MRSVNSNARKRLTVCLVVSLLLSVSVSGFITAPLHLLGQHQAAEKMKHAELATEAGAHGHSHHDGEGHEQREGHLHGHNPADHSHETPYVAVMAFPARVPIPNVHVIDAGVEPKIGAGNRLERPPRTVFLI